MEKTTSRHSFVDRLYGHETIASYLKKNPGFGFGEKPPAKSTKKSKRKIV